MHLSNPRLDLCGTTLEYVTACLIKAMGAYGEYSLYENGHFVKSLNHMEAVNYCKQARELGLEVIETTLQMGWTGWTIKEKS